MRTHTFLFAVATSICLLSSCKKEGEFNQADVATEISDNNSLQSAGWFNIPDWASQNESGHFLYNSEIKDPAITKEVIEEGLILIYQKNNSSTIQLPFTDEQVKSGANWFYQVFEGKISIFTETSMATSFMTEKNFQYFVITPEKLSSLKEKGFSKSDLFQLGFDGVAKLFQ